MKKGFYLDDRIYKPLADLLGSHFDINFAGTLESAAESIEKGEYADFIITELFLEPESLESFCKRRKCILSSLSDASFDDMQERLKQFLELETLRLKKAYKSNFYLLARLKKNSPDTLRIIYSSTSPNIYSLFNAHKLADKVLTKTVYDPMSDGERLIKIIESGRS